MAKDPARCQQCGRLLGTGEELVCAICGTVGGAPTKPPAGDAPDPLIGQALGEFEIIERLGCGRMGVVYKARQPSLERFVAVKILKSALTLDSHGLKLFQREARAAAAVNHPNIIQVYTLGEDGGRQYIAMEFVEGEGLDGLLKREGKLAPDRALEIFKQVASALAKAHDAKIVHRDLKPANILVTPDGQAKVADFGLAKRLGSDVSATQIGDIMGTPLYFPPEAALGKPYDHRSDLYSLGATFYHLLAGKPPFDGDNVMALALSHANDPVPPLDQVAPATPIGLCDIIARLLCKEPAERFQSAADLLDALNRVALAPPGHTGNATAPAAPTASAPASKAVQVAESPPEGREVAVDLGHGVSLGLVRVPAGSFRMGSEASGSDEKPVHSVTFAEPFYIGKYAITQEQWQAVTGSNPSGFPDPRNPVEQVSWNACQDFLKKLNDKTGRMFALPSEAEWEYACRAGSTTEYCFGDAESGLGEYAWHDSNSGDTTHPVGQKKPNAWGLYDTHGNVWEWCEDVSHGSYEGAPADGSAWLQGGDHGVRVLRGGSWGLNPGYCRSAHRLRAAPMDAWYRYGVRVVFRGFHLWK